MKIKYIILFMSTLINTLGDNNWCCNNNLCRLRYDIPRSLMPQIKNDTGINFNFGYYNPKEIIPYQNKIFQDKINGLSNYLKNNMHSQEILNDWLTKYKIFLANDTIHNKMRVIDGHHRWGSIIELNNHRYDNNLTPFILKGYKSPYDDNKTWNLFHQYNSCLENNDTECSFL